MSTTAGASIWFYGYNAGSFEQFTTGLNDAGIDQLWDVRIMPMSQRTEFDRFALAQFFLNQNKTKYLSVTHLGNPYRYNFTGDKDWEETAEALRKFYRSNRNAKHHIGLIAEEILTKNTKICLMCACRHTDRCHVSVLLECVKATHTKLRQDRDKYTALNPLGAEVWDNDLQAIKLPIPAPPQKKNPQLSLF